MKKNKEIFVAIDDFFRNIIKYKNSDKLVNFFNFTKRMPKHAPFNDALVFIQNPDCFFYTTASQWEKRFGRVVHRGARPLVTLVPFGPVGFVYDYKDTEGEQSIEELRREIEWWAEEEQKFDERVIEKTIKKLKQFNITVEFSKNTFTYIEDNSMQTMGYASRSVDDIVKNKIVLHPRYIEGRYLLESYGVLCHEIAHHLLGHLGEISASNKNGNSKVIVNDRSTIDKNIRELEAELVAWIVFLKHGIEKKSVDYMASWIINDDDFEKVEIAHALKVANKICSLG